MHAQDEIRTVHSFSSAVAETRGFVCGGDYCCSLDSPWVNGDATNVVLSGESESEKVIDRGRGKDFYIVGESGPGAAESTSLACCF